MAPPPFVNELRDAEQALKNFEAAYRSNRQGTEPSAVVLMYEGEQLLKVAAEVV
jgi:hypothetical protein